MSIEFPLPFRSTAFGVLSDPRIPVQVPSPNGELDLRFLLDTGAEFAVASCGLAEDVGFDWATMPVVHMYGIEMGIMPARFDRLRIRIADVELTVRCMFVDRPRVPLILGRADFLDRFVVTIDQPRRTIILDPV